MRNAPRRVRTVSMAVISGPGCVSKVAKSASTGQNATRFVLSTAIPENASSTLGNVLLDVIPVIQENIVTNRAQYTVRTTFAIKPRRIAQMNVMRATTVLNVNILAPRIAQPLHVIGSLGHVPLVAMICFMVCIAISHVPKAAKAAAIKKTGTVTRALKAAGVRNVLRIVPIARMVATWKQVSAMESAMMAILASPVIHRVPRTVKPVGVTKSLEPVPKVASIPSMAQTAQRNAQPRANLSVVNALLATVTQAARTGTMIQNV